MLSPPSLDRVSFLIPRSNSAKGVTQLQYALNPLEMKAKIRKVLIFPFLKKYPKSQ